MKKIVIMAVLLVTVLVALAACDGSAEDDGTVGVFRIGLTIDENDPFGGMAHETFRRDMEEYLGIPVIAIEEMTYLVAIEAMRAGHLDMVIASAFNYISARAVVDVELLVAPPFLGMPGPSSVFITHADRYDINTVEDLRGRTFAFVNAASTTGFLFPAFHLVTELGLDPTLLTNSGHFFSTAIFSGAHDASIMGVIMGDFDGAAVTPFIIRSLTDSGMINPDYLKIVGETPSVGGVAYMIRSELPQEFINQVQSFLLNYDNEEFFYAAYNNPTGRYSLPDFEAFEYVAEMVYVMGM